MKRHTGDTKQCRKCGETLPVAGFSVSSWGTPQSWCKKCTAENTKKWQEKNPEKVHSYSRERDLSKYGMTTDDYESLLQRQGRRCASCGSKEAGGRWNTYFLVDHCHETGKVRGLICHACNIAVGFLGNCPDRARSVLSYIEGFSS